MSLTKWLNASLSPTSTLNAMTFLSALKHNAVHAFTASSKRFWLRARMPQIPSLCQALILTARF